MLGFNLHRFSGYPAIWGHTIQETQQGQQEQQGDQTIDRHMPSLLTLTTADDTTSRSALDEQRYRQAPVRPGLGKRIAKQAASATNVSWATLTLPERPNFSWATLTLPERR